MMFSNFEDAFKNNRLSNKIPKEILDFLNEDLPEGFEYSNIGKGTYAVIPTSSEISVNIEIPKDLLMDFKPSTMQELMEYMYRTQETLEILPDKEGFITINGSKLDIKQIIKIPLEEKEVKVEAMVIKPEPFQLPFNISLEGYDVKRDILIQRQPYPDMTKSLFKNIDNEVLEISYIIDEKNNGMNFTLETNIEKSKSINEILEVLKIYRSFLKKHIKIGGKNIFEFATSENRKFESNQEKISETIKFWTRLLNLERVLEISFVPEFPIKLDDALWLEKLYRSFVDKKPYKEYIKIDKFTVPITEELEKDLFVGNKNLVFILTQNSELDIWGVKLGLYDTVGIFDFKIDKIELENKETSEYNIFVKSINENDIYSSVRHFYDEEDAHEYIKNIEQLKNAKIIEV